MGLGDIFKSSNKLEEQIKALQSEITELKGKIVGLEQENARLSAFDTPEAHDLNNVRQELQQLTQQRDEIRSDIDVLRLELSRKNNEIVQLDDEILLQSVGLYTPQFDFAKSEQYKTKLDEIREKQKAAIKEDKAVTSAPKWSVNGSTAQGSKMVMDFKKLLLRAFNSECDDLVEHVKYSNYDSYMKRMSKSRDAISKLGAVMSISITEYYFNLKQEELTLAFEYALKKQQEKEEQKEIKARMREEAKIQKEIEEQRAKLEKEQAHYLNALAKLRLQLANNPNDSDLLEKQKEIEAQLTEIDKGIKDVDYREANKRAGYVYVISNIGAFGENVYKIGMTRRLDPMERVDELGDASVPFDFDVHALIFSEDAPKLEAALHRAFENKKVNFVNHRREFFNVTLQEIKDVVTANYDKTVEWNDYAEAEQYRISLKMKKGQ